MVEKMDQFSAWNESQIFGAQEVAKSYGQLIMTLVDIEFIAKS